MIKLTKQKAIAVTCSKTEIENSNFSWASDTKNLKPINNNTPAAMKEIKIVKSFFAKKITVNIYFFVACNITQGVGLTVSTVLLYGSVNFFNEFELKWLM